MRLRSSYEVTFPDEMSYEMPTDWAGPKHCNDFHPSEITAVAHTAVAIPEGYKVDPATCEVLELAFDRACTSQSIWSAVRTRSKDR